MAKDKIQFAPLPVRAIADRRLAGDDLRVLAQICYHDRLSASRKQGAGCWASNKALAEACNVHYTNLSASCTRLSQLGYIVREAHPINRRLRIYRVIYDSLPADKLNGLPTDKVSDADTLPTDQQSDPERSRTVANADDSLSPDQQKPAIVCRPILKGQEDQSLSGVEYITHKREDITLKRETYSPEGARFAQGLGKDRIPVNDGHYLSSIEKSLKASPSTYIDRYTREAIEKIINSTDHSDSVHQWAVRLLEQYGDRVPAPRPKPPISSGVATSRIAQAALQEQLHKANAAIDAMHADNREWEAAFDAKHPDYPQSTPYELVSNEPLPDGIMEAIAQQVAAAAGSSARCAA